MRVLNKRGGKNLQLLADTALAERDRWRSLVDR